jgi:membrane protease YdiL (CAAX protease family)
LTEPGSTVDDESPADQVPVAGPSGPPGGRIFTLEDRPVPALYFASWLFSAGGIAALLIATQAQASVGRSLMSFAGVVSLGIGLAAAAGYQVVARTGRPRDMYRGPSPLLLFGLVLVVSTLGSAVLGLAGLVDPDQPIGFLFGLLVVGLAYIACIELFVVRAGALSWAAMGWPARHPGLLHTLLRDAGVAFLVMIPVTLGVIAWGGLLATALHVTAPETLPDAHDSAEALAIVLAAVVVAPVGEEAFFRGFVLTAWLRDLGARAALIRSALFFAVVHILNIRVAAEDASQGLGQALLQFAVILPLGLALGWLFLRRGIVASIAGHMTYNGILLALLALARAATSGS